MSDNPSAFPTHDQTQTTDPRSRILQGGMTLRDYFAGQALAGVITVCNNDTELRNGTRPEDYFAIKAYAIADAMLAARTGDA